MRARKVTRTFKATEATIMVVEIETAEVCTVTIKLPHEFKNDAEIMKHIEKNHGLLNDGLKAVAVVDYIVTEQLYAMDEQKFIENAEVIPDRK